MSLDASSESIMAPPASLTAVQIRRRSIPASPSVKPGDITHRLLDIAPPVPSGASAGAGEAGARPTMLELAKVVDAIPASRVVPPEPPAVAEPSDAAPRGPIPDDIVDYWRLLRADRTFASPADLDATLFSFRWPDSMLLAYVPDTVGTGQTPAVAKVSRLGLPRCATGESKIEYTPLITEWVLSLGRDVVRSGEAVEEYGRFPTENGIAGYRIVALPLSSGADRPDHVLCSLTCAESSTRFGRRRTRLQD